jgi:hypothetical protein
LAAVSAHSETFRTVYRPHRIAIRSGVNSHPK